MKRLSIVFLLFTTSALSAEKSMKELLSMPLEELMQVDIVGSTLTPEKLKTVPSAVSVYTHQDIMRLGLDTLGELMNLVPGFQSYRSSGSSLETPYSSRGRRIGTTTAEILVLIDGRRFDSPRSSGSSTLAPTYPLKIVEKIEFIRGPGAAIYGSNAMMGIINITTRSNVNEVSVGYGSLNRKQIYLQTADQYGEMKMDFFGHIEADDGENYSVQDTFSENQVVTNDPRKIADLNLKFSWKNSQINISHNEFSVENFYELDKISNGFNSRDGKITAISLEHEFDFQVIKSNLKYDFKHVSAKLNAQFTAPGSLAPVSVPSSNEPLYIFVDFKNYTENRILWHNNWNVNKKNSLQFGVELRRIDAPETVAKNNYDLAALSVGDFPIEYYLGEMLATTPVQAKSERNIIGIYSQYQHKLFESTNLTLGLRYDDFSDIDSQVSPRLGLVHELNKHHSVKLLYGEAFRAPSESELNLLNNPVILGNPDLKPETVKSLDLIWIGQWEHTGISLGYFENNYDDSIVVINIGNDIFQYMNAEQGPSKGYEVEVSHELNKHWLLRASFTHLNTTPELSFREAEQFGSFTINYQIVNWNANVISHFVDKREIESGTDIVKLDSYVLLYGKIQYDFSEILTVFIQAKNLLDEKYYTPSVGGSIAQGVPNRGRQLLAGVSWRF